MQVVKGEMSEPTNAGETACAPKSWLANSILGVSVNPAMDRAVLLLVLLNGTDRKQTLLLFLSKYL